MSPLNFLKNFKSKRYSPEMLNTIEHVLSFCSHVLEGKEYITISDEWDQRLFWAYSQALKKNGCQFPIGRSSNMAYFFNKWIETIPIDRTIVINEIGACMLSYLHSSLYDMKYYRKLYAEFNYYRYIKRLKEKAPDKK